MKILFADDEASLRAAMRIILTNAGYEVVEARTGRDALAAFDRDPCDLVILDVMMPGLDGFETCRLLRERSATVPVLLLTARGDIADKKVGFRTGADDYLTKPFDPEELQLHVEALLRRAARSGEGAPSGGGAAAPAPRATIVDVGDLHIDLVRREVLAGKVAAQLTPIEFDILGLLAEQPGRVYSRDEIAERIWGAAFAGREQGVAPHVRHLREKIEPDPASPTYVKTVGRFGYRLGE